MLNRNYILSFTAALLFFNGQVSFSQTTKWTISWNENSEADMSHYILYRDISPGAVIRIATINHPGTQYIDLDIEKNVLYYYRLKAVNLSQNESGFSDEISAAVPEIDFPNTLKNSFLSAGQSFEIVLDNYVSDPDDTDNNLQWEISGNTQLDVQLNTLTHIAVISAPDNWDTQEVLQFTVTDPDSFKDISVITVFSDSSSIPDSTNIKINAYPIPYEPARHLNSRGITFSNLPDNSKLIIYNFLGEPVFKKSGLSGRFIWDIKNNSDKTVSSGLYLYYVKTNGKTASGKLVIVR